MKVFSPKTPQRKAMKEKDTCGIQYAATKYWWSAHIKTETMDWTWRDGVRRVREHVVCNLLNFFVWRKCMWLTGISFLVLGGGGSMPKIFLKDGLDFCLHPKNKKKGKKKNGGAIIWMIVWHHWIERAITRLIRAIISSWPNYIHHNTCAFFFFFFLFYFYFGILLSKAIHLLFKLNFGYVTNPSFTLLLWCVICCELSHTKKKKKNRCLFLWDTIC